MKKFIAKHMQKIRYLAIGGWNTVFGYGIFVILNLWLSGDVNYLIILTISYIFSITNAYIGYKFFVFQTKGNILREYFRFYFVYGGAFIFNLVTLPLFVELLMLNMYAAQAVVTILTILGSYVLHKNFSFKAKQ